MLVVWSDDNVGDQLKFALSSEGFSVFTARSAAEASNLLDEGPWDVVVGDFSDVIGGHDLLATALSTDLFSQVIFYENEVTVAQAVEFMQAGAWTVLVASDAGVAGLANAVRGAWMERLTDLELAKEHGIE